jgi:hypothetical protein
MSEPTMLAYFWREKGDYKRYVGYEKWAAENPEEAYKLEVLSSKVKEAEQQVTNYISHLEDISKDKPEEAVTNKPKKLEYSRWQLGSLYDAR